MRISPTWAAGLVLASFASAAHAANDGEGETPNVRADPAEEQPPEDPPVEEPAEETESLLGALKTLYADEEITVTWGGRIMFDMGWFDSNSMYPASDAGTLTFPNEDDGLEFRRARLFVKGTIYDTILFKAQYDFAGGDADFRDVYIGYESPIGRVQVGHMKEPLSLEQLTSSRFITFMERALPVTAFVPDRNSGAIAYGPVDEDWAYSLGWFRDSDTFGDDSDDDTGDGQNHVSARFAGALWNRDEAKDVLHVGVSGLYSASRKEHRVRTRPEAHLLDYVFDTGTLEDDGSYVVGAEAAWVKGPLSVQGEYVMTSIDEFGGAGSSDVDFGGWYVFGSYFITGESRAYKDSLFHRIEPSENWTGGWGGGAWEAVARYSMVDFDDAAFDTEVSDVTLGLNWYLNPYTRIMFNYVYSSVDQPSASIDDDMHGFMIRFQVDW